MTSRLVLGTAQFGLDYGAVNTRGKVAADGVCSILGEARRAGIDCLDTAVAYGDAEQVLAQCGTSGFRIITKVPRLEPRSASNARTEIVSIARQSCQTLGCASLYGLMLHNAADLGGIHGSEVLAGLMAAKDTGLTEKIGVSVYSADEIDLVLNCSPGIDIIQLPLSVFDQRLLNFLPRLAERGIEIHVRSVFLQGLLLCTPESLPPQHVALVPMIEAFHIRAAAAGLAPIEAALAFVRDLADVDGVVVGTTHLDEFRSVVAAWQRDSVFDADELAISQPQLIDPRLWVRN